MRGPFERTWAELTQPTACTEAALDALVVLSVLLVVSNVGDAAMVPKQGATFSEFSLLTEGEDGELVADDCPTELARGEPAPLVLAIEIHGHEPVDTPWWSNSSARPWAPSPRT